MKTRCPINTQTACSFISGILLVFAFAPWQWYGLAPLAMAGFAYPVLRAQSWQEATRCGWWFGFGYFLFGISWVYVSMHDFGNMHLLLAALFTFLFCGLLAWFPALVATVSWQWRDQSGQWVLVTACAWVLAEWIRSNLFTGFPWLLLGYSQTRGVLSKLAPLIGVYGLSFVTLLIGLLLVVAWKHLRAREQNFSGQFIVIGMLFTLIGMYLIPFPHWTTPQENDTTVALIQGNIPQSLKWSEAYANKTVDIYRTLSGPYWNDDVVIWPESAVPILWPFAAENLSSIGQILQTHHSTLITGIPVMTNDETYYNAIMAFGAQPTSYRKHHLVPFGEFIPFTNILRHLGGLFDLPMSDFQAGDLQQPTINAGLLRLAPFICYEIAYSDSVLANSPPSNALLTLSNDAWFGSMAASQHLQMAQMRSLQTGRPQLFVNNTGKSAIIGADGSVQAQTVQNKQTTLEGSLVGYEGMTPWLYYGDTPILITCLILLFSFISLRFSPILPRLLLNSKKGEYS